MGAGISGGGPPWAHEAGGVPYRGGAPPSWPGGSSLRGDFCIVNSQIFPKKIILNWHGILRTFIFGIFLYCTNKSGNRHKILFYFISTK